MILDDATKFSDRQSLVGLGPGTVFSTNVVPLGSAVRDIGQGTPAYVHFQISDTIVGGVTTTLQFFIAFDIVSVFNTASATIIIPASSHVLNFAALAAGFNVVLPIPPQPAVFALLGLQEAFMAVGYVLGGTVPTAGTVSARVTLDPHSYRAITADAAN